MEKVTVIYIKNPLDPYYSREFSYHEPGKTIRELTREVCTLTDLDIYEIVPSVNGCEFLPDKAMDYVCQPGDTLGFAVVPGKGGSGKMILSIVAMVVLMVVAPVIAGYMAGEMVGYGFVMTGVEAMQFSALSAITYGLTYGAVMVAGGLLLSAIAPKPPAIAEATTETATYSWNPTQNYILEGATLPILYGTHRIVPPIISKYISNSGDKQYLHVLLALAGHEIDDVLTNQIRINENPKSYWTDVVEYVRTGKHSQATIPGFDRTSSESAVSTKLNAPTLIRSVTKVYTTNPAKFEIVGHGWSNDDSILIKNFSGTGWEGLNNLSKAITVVDVDNIELEGVNAIGWATDGETTKGQAHKWLKRSMGANESADQLAFLISCPKGLYYANEDGSTSDVTVKFKLQYRPHPEPDNSNETGWINADVSVGDDIQSVEETYGRWVISYYGINSEGVLTWTILSDPSPAVTDYYAHYEGEPIYWEAWAFIGTDDAGGGYYVPYDMGATWHWIGPNTPVDIVVSSTYGFVGITGREAKPIYRYFYSPRFSTPGRYDLRVTMFEEPPVSNRQSGDTYWESYALITNKDFNYPGTALLGIKALATDQLSGGVPKIDLLISRSKVWIRDASNARVQKNADNPAWACLHILQQDGLGIPYDRCDYTAFSTWADYCDNVADVRGIGAVVYKVNIYLDQPQTIRKQLDTVSLLGRGTVVQLGSKFTVITDKIDSSTQKFSFGMGNIIKDSFSEEWIPYDDRANAIEVTYFDADYDYQRQSIEVYASDYDTSNRPVNKAAVTLFGCTSLAEATAYGRFILNNNRYITRVASWDASVDAIACIPGDIVTVSHDVPMLGNSGRIVEPKNRVSYPDDFSNAYWIKYTGCTITSDAITAPDATSLADKIKPTDNGSYRSVYTSPPVITGSIISFYAKAGEITKIAHQCGGGDDVSWNLSTGALILKHAYVPAAGIVDAGSGWYRCWIETGTYQHGGYIMIGAEGTESCDGTKGFYLWGVQQERGRELTAYWKTDPTKDVYLDQPVVIEAGKTYHVSVRHQDTDTIETKQVATGAGTHTELTITTTWSTTPATYANYVFGVSSSMNKQYRVTKISRATDLTRKVTGIEYYTQVYDETGSVVTIPEYEAQFGATHISVNEVYKGGSETKVSASWVGVALNWHLWVEYYNSSTSMWEVPIYIGTTRDNSYIIGDLNQTATLRVTVSHTTNCVDGMTSENITLVGKTIVPSDVSSISATADKFTVSISWTPVEDFDVSGYEVRSDTNWGSTGSALIYRGMSTICKWTVKAAGSYTIYVKAIDAFGNWSANYASTSLNVVGPTSVTGLSYVLNSSGEIVFSWNPVSPTGFDVAYYQITYDSTTISSKVTTYSLKVSGWSGTKRFYVTPVDVAGTSGDVAFIDVTIYIPQNITALSATVIDNNVLLKWTNPSGNTVNYLPVNNVEVRRGTTWAGATSFGNKAGSFTVVFETQSGNNTYWVCPIDTAGNYGATPQSVTVDVKAPPDYIMYGRYDTTWTGSKTNCFLQSGKLYTPVSSATWIGRFSPNSYTNINSFFYSGYEYIYQPAPITAGSYVEGFDCSTPGDGQANCYINVGLDRAAFDGSPATQINIKTTPSSGTAWTDWGTTNPVYVTGFRHALVTLTTSSTGLDDTDVLNSMYVRLDAKQRTDTGVNTSVYDAAGGTAFTMSVTFQKVLSINLTCMTNSPWYAVAQYTDGEDHFHAYVYGHTGNRQTCGVSWTVRGV